MVGGWEGAAGEVVEGGGVGEEVGGGGETATGEGLP